MVLDVAHNPAGAWALRSALSENFAGRELTLVFAAMRDKAIQEIAEVLFPIAEQVVLTHVNNPRAATPAELVQSASRTGAEMYTEDNVAAALRKAHELASRMGSIVVTGSIFLVGEAMARWRVRRKMMSTADVQMKNAGDDWWSISSSRAELTRTAYLHVNGKA